MKKGYKAKPKVFKIPLKEASAFVRAILLQRMLTENTDEEINELASLADKVWSELLSIWMVRNHHAASEVQDHLFDAIGERGVVFGCEINDIWTLTESTIQRTVNVPIVIER